jgi:hypothetical protein
MRTNRMLTIAFGAVLSLYAQAPPDFIPPTPLPSEEAPGGRR